MQALKKLCAFGSKVIVRRDPPETESAGGIVLPETNANRPSIGTVVSVGPLVNKDAKCDAEKVDEGTRIHFNQYAGQLIKHGDEELLCISAEDIFAFMNVL